MTTPTIGRIVHFIVPGLKGKDAERPAIIVRVWSETCVNLHVFADGANDHESALADGGWKTSVCLDDKKNPGTWHWPEQSPLIVPKGMIGKDASDSIFDAKEEPSAENTGVVAADLEAAETEPKVADVPTHD